MDSGRADDKRDSALSATRPPPANHPWRQLARGAINLKAVREAGEVKITESLRGQNH
jgi:hypothetical protein